jgi:hypothetical protein
MTADGDKKAYSLLPFAQLIQLRGWNRTSIRQSHNDLENMTEKARSRYRSIRKVELKIVQAISSSLSKK